MPQFLEGQQAGNQGQQGQGEDFIEYLREYQTLGEEFQAAMSLQDLCTIKYRNKPRDFNKGPQSWELQGKWENYPSLTLMALENPLLGHGYRSWTPISNLTP
jgi:hypothetical protein